MTTKPNPSSLDLTTAISLSIASQQAAAAAQVCTMDPITVELIKLSLRFAELALEALGGEPGKHDEATSA